MLRKNDEADLLSWALTSAMPDSDVTSTSQEAQAAEEEQKQLEEFLESLSHMSDTGATQAASESP